MDWRVITLLKSSCGIGIQSLIYLRYWVGLWCLNRYSYDCTEDFVIIKSCSKSVGFIEGLVWSFLLHSFWFIICWHFNTLYNLDYLSLVVLFYYQYPCLFRGMEINLFYKVQMYPTFFMPLIHSLKDVHDQLESPGSSILRRISPCIATTSLFQLPSVRCPISRIICKASYLSPL